MHVFRNIQVPDTMQQIKKLKIQKYRTWLKKLIFCKRGGLRIGYGENAIWYILASVFRAGYRGKQ